jgi:hypothetical protein
VVDKFILATVMALEDLDKDYQFALTALVALKTLIININLH